MICEGPPLCQQLRCLSLIKSQRNLIQKVVRGWLSSEASRKLNRSAEEANGRN
ncbi:hypothetical protein BVIET440_250055 [Burkholderia vietnamiensis]